MVIEVNKRYTGRKIAIFNGSYSLLEPLEAIIEDIKRLGITEIYSLGNNIGFGPKPVEVIDTLEAYGIKSVIGNFEKYCTLGFRPYNLSDANDILKSREWTLAKLGAERLNFIKTFPYSYDIDIGGQKAACCCFANDIRTDYYFYNSESYSQKFKEGESYEQFLYTNSPEHFKTIQDNIDRFGYNAPLIKGYVSARDYPLFGGKPVTWYNAIIQGSSNKTLFETADNTAFYTISPLVVSKEGFLSNIAFYIILHERTNGEGFALEKRYVIFNGESMEKAILNSDEPTGRMKKLIRSK